MDPATIIGLIVTLLTVVIGPILAFVIKRYWDKKTEDAADEKRKQDEEQKKRDEDKELADRQREINDSIEKQRKAKDEWIKNQ